MSKSSLNVVEFPGANLMDVPNMLRLLADSIVDGKHGAVDTVYVVIPNGAVPEIIGIGRVDDPIQHPIVQLNLALHGMYRVAES